MNMNNIKVYYVILLAFFIVTSSAHYVGESDIVTLNENGQSLENNEMMHTAEAQNPFLPKFAMKRLKEKREHNAQRQKEQYNRIDKNSQQRVPCQRHIYNTRH